MRTLTYVIEPSSYPDMMAMTEGGRTVVSYVDPATEDYVADMRRIAAGHARGLAECLGVLIQPVIIWDDGVRDETLALQPSPNYVPSDCPSWMTWP